MTHKTAGPDRYVDILFIYSFFPPLLHYILAELNKSHVYSLEISSGILWETMQKISLSHVIVSIF